MIPKKEFETVPGGSTVVEGSALMRVTGLGDDSTLGKIIKTVQEAQVSKPEIQELADNFAKYFVPTVMVISIGTFLVWLILAEMELIPSRWVEHGGGSFLLAFTFGLAVWVSACPCAFGLATPTAVLVATGVAAKYGVLIRRGAALQTASEVRKTQITNCIL
jgi:Cu+-exporting ATPase